MTATSLSEGERYAIQPIHPANEPNMRSLNSDIQTSVLFINKRCTPIHLYWRDFNGGRTSYGLVQPGGERPMTTYITHAWVVVDEESKEVLGIWNPVERPGEAIFT
ncbi:hypothetical protein FRB93_013824 [Tulasnella sp. JGI-2019a]|nr:hypothetical protein FRB93_013824 [Tulasnella sp. JGI-2019a]